MPIRQLSATRPGRKLRWTKDGALSIRAYAFARDEEACPCVSTRSAELMIVLDGEVVLEVGPAGQLVRVRAGEASWVPRGLSHVVRTTADVRAFIVDEPDLDADRGVRVVALPARLVRTLDLAWKKEPPRALASVVASVPAIIARLDSQEPLAIETSPSTRRMMRAKAILEERYAQPPKLGELARIVRTNEFYLLRSFKQHFGFTPLAYARFLRTEHFLWELLGANAQRTLGRLSSEAGFRDYSTFERRIRAVLGRPPSEAIDPDGNGRLGPA